MKGRDWATAKDCMQKAKKYKKKYDFRRSLNFKLNASIDYIDKEGANEARNHRR
jgi:hypothetical protein